MAKSKTKKISITAFDTVLKERFLPTETIDWYGLEIEIKKTISLSETIEFVTTVSESCFTSEENMYLPEVKDFAIRCCILEYYSNLTLPNNTEHKHQLVYGTDAVQAIMPHINKEQFRAIIDAINDKIDNMAQANIEAIHKQMNEVCIAFRNLENQFGSAFSNIRPDEMMKFIKSLDGNTIDEEKLVKAYINHNTAKGSK